MSDVLLVGDDAPTLAGLAGALGTRAEHRVLGASAPDQLGEALSQVVPDLLLWDLPEAHVKATLPLVALVVDGALGRTLLRAGARGVLERDVPLEKLSAALSACAAGLRVYDDVLAEEILSAPDVRPDSPISAALTARERQVLELLTEGLSNRQIAEALDVTTHTAKFHVNAILEKLGAETRTEAVVLAVRLGLVHL